MLAQSNLLDKYQKELTDYDQVRLPHALIANDGMKLGEVMRTLNSEMICPICLDLLQETTVTECLHRFCAKCISSAIYKSNRECPTCRKKLISKRNLRADPNMDLLISAIWPDRAVYEQMQNEQAQKWSLQSNAQMLQKSIAEGIKEQAMARKHAPSPLAVEHLTNVDEEFVVQPKKAPDPGRPRKFPMPLTVGLTVQKQQLLPSTSKTPSTSMPMDVDFSSDESDSDFSSSDLSTSSAMDNSSADEYVEAEMKQFDQLALPEELKQIYQMTSPNNLKQFTQLKTPQNLKQFTQLITPKDLKLKQFNQLTTPPNDFRGSKATDSDFGEDSPQPKKTKLLRDFSLTPSPMHNKSNILVNATAKSKQSSPKTAIPLLDFSNSSDSSGYQSFSSQGNQQSTKLESMENFVQNYKEQGLMGIVTLVLQPLPRALGGKMLARGSPMKNLRNSRVCLPHTSTVGELSLKIADDMLPVSPQQQQQCCSSSAPPMDLSAQIRFFIQTPLKQLVELYPPDSICTVLALGDRANLYSFPTVYFSVAK